MSQDPSNIPPELLLQHTDYLRALARGLVQGEAEIEDLVQETWVKALEHPPNKQSALRTWLGRVLRNRAHDRWRRSITQQDKERLAAKSINASSKAEALEQQELLARLVGAIKELPDHYRHMIHLRYFDGLPPGEIATKCDIPLVTVKVRLRRPSPLPLTRLKNC